MFDVSAISYIKNDGDYFVVDRESGAPLSGIKVHYKLRDYDYKKGDYKTTAAANKTTDAHGKISLPKNGDGGNRLIELTIYGNKDTLQTEEYGYYSTYTNDDASDYDSASEYEADKANMYFLQTEVFTGPVKKVYYKGIAVTKDSTTKQSKLFTYKDSIQINFLDANGKQIDSSFVKLNDYGAFSGIFTIPQNVLTGEFSIETEDFEGEATFHVEEYKRPTFFLQFDTLATAYHLLDTIKITGYAKAYAGNAIANAQVAFNVQRSTRFIYPWIFQKNFTAIF